MAKYQKYAEYKDSGVEWLGEIPGHWDSKPLKYLCTYNDEVLSETTYKEAEIQYIDIGSVSAVDGISHIEEMIFKDAPSSARRIVKDGDVIVSTVRNYLEAIAPIDNPPENLIVSTGFAVIRPNQYLYKGFAAYCLRAKGFIKEVVARSVGVSYPAINSSELVGITIPSVEYSEQVKIANFLDHETAQIDSLIEKQQQLIQLLKEKRQAVISHAVTKGLNPNVSMKDAGVEWIGPIPSHWQVKKLKRLFAKIEYGISESTEQEGNYAVLKMGNIVQGEIAFTKIEYVNEVSPQLLLETDDLLFNRTNSLDQVAKVAVFRGSVNDDITFASYLVRLRTNHKNFSHYINYLVNTEAFLGLARKMAIPSVQQANLNPTRYGRLEVPVPPFSEQKLIAAYLDEKTRQISAVVQCIKNQITTLTNYRKSLIHECVTGKRRITEADLAKVGANV